MDPMDAFASSQKLSLEEFGQHFETFRSRAFRFECLPIYRVASEKGAFINFSRGEKNPPSDFNENWIEILKKVSSRRAEIQRVRLLTSTPTEYIRFECEWGYKRQTKYGEKILFLEENTFKKINNFSITIDYWLFDEDIAYYMIYDFVGQFMGVLKANNLWTTKLREQATRLVTFAKDISFLDAYLLK